MTIKYTKDHEWVRVEGDVGTVGVSDHAQHQLGDVVFVELPDVGRQLAQGKEAAVVESVKAASDVFAPVSGEVIEANADLENDPSLVNAGAETTGWFFKLRLSNPSELDGLMDEAAYKAFVEGQA
ncbi:glycine cleavage system H protein [Azospirillum brasilense]|uniref:Glycine cleavage system H protein n=3 Tax=Azospirillum TaxID=191 RepID=A0A9P1JRY1_9PROT|nr:MULTISPECIES: glycine cleavage system protein GcvH [Azospirillum]AWJ89495.1 glycine cleavage system protein H [Azospirillum baldaniorum]NUB10015.1 glycine cleavage system protein GcvH [Azospirillum baldaniorum]TWA64512.1 glycine cleavage system H protein [Azospirillum brasilense]TWA81099.1 glycine cleavage system H protein [Azospirillum brasilense]CCC98612.1 glycine cleavage system H-protein [Azospirillum baldaniorum]